MVSPAEPLGMHLHHAHTHLFPAKVREVPAPCLGGNRAQSHTHAEQQELDSGP